jgi:hypothetical protein
MVSREAVAASGADLAVVVNGGSSRPLPIILRKIPLPFGYKVRIEGAWSLGQHDSKIIANDAADRNRNPLRPSTMDSAPQ